LWYARSVNWTFRRTEKGTLAAFRGCYIPTNGLSYDPEPIQATTKDRVSVGLNLVLRFRIVDVGKAVTSVRDLFAELENLVCTATFEAVGSLPLDELQCQAVKDKMQVAKLSKVAEGWGVEFLSLDVQDIIMPENLQTGTVATVAARHTSAAEMDKILQEHKRRIQMAETEQQEQSIRLNLELQAAKHELAVRRLTAEAEAVERLAMAKAQAEARQMGQKVERDGYALATEVKLERLRRKLELYEKHPTTAGFYEHDRLAHALSRVSQGENTKVILAPLDTLSSAARMPVAQALNPQ
jgi:regulator of protease activity HflC (stomatin/prohibitin superfamily)